MILIQLVHHSKNFESIMMVKLHLRWIIQVGALPLPLSFTVICDFSPHLEQTLPEQIPFLPRKNMEIDLVAGSLRPNTRSMRVQQHLRPPWWWRSDGWMIRERSARPNDQTLLSRR